MSPAAFEAAPLDNTRAVVSLWSRHPLQRPSLHVTAVTDLVAFFSSYQQLLAPAARTLTQSSVPRRALSAGEPFLVTLRAILQSNLQTTCTAPSRTCTADLVLSTVPPEPTPSMDRTFAILAPTFQTPSLATLEELRAGQSPSLDFINLPNIFLTLTLYLHPIIRSQQERSLPS